MLVSWVNIGGAARGAAVPPSTWHKSTWLPHVTRAGERYGARSDAPQRPRLMIALHRPIKYASEQPFEQPYRRADELGPLLMTLGEPLF